MKTLTVSLADLEGVPHSSSLAGTNVKVTAAYTSPLTLTDGRIVPVAIKEKQLPNTGAVEFEVYASDDAAVRAEDRGFAIIFTARLTGRGGKHVGTFTRTVKPLKAMTSPIPLGTLDPAEPLAPKWVSVGELVDDVQAAKSAAQAAVAAVGPAATAAAAPAVAAAQSAQADAAQSADDADSAALLAQQAQAAALEVPDANVTALAGNPASQLAQVLSSQQAHVPASLYGMATSKTGPQNKAALLNAVAAADGRAVYIGPGAYSLDKITDADFGGRPARLVGAGGRVATDKRWTLGSPSWATDGPTGTVLRCASTLAVGEPFIDVGNTVDATSTSLHSLVLLGQGAGIGLRAGQAVPTMGGGHPVRWDFQGLTIANFDIGMTHTGENGVLVAPYIVGCGDGFYAGYPFNGNTVLGINVERVTRSAIRLDHAITNVFLGGVLQASYPTLATILLENSALGNVFEGIYCENYAPTTGAHAGTLYEVHVGPSGTPGPCYGNVFRNMHWGSSSTSVKIVVHNAYFTELTMDHAASGTTSPTVELNGGWGHDVSGVFPAVTGIAVPKSRVRNMTGAAAATDVVETHGWNLATAGYVKVGSTVTLPDPVKAGPGGFYRDQQSRVMVDSDGAAWAPTVSRLTPFSTGAGGAVNGGGAGGMTWMRYTHIKFTAATGFALWPAGSATVDRAYHLRNGKASGNLVVTPQSGETLDGSTSGSVTLGPGQGAWFAVSADSSAWISV